MPFAFALALLLGLISPPAEAIEVLGGPYVLHSNVAGQWGGHTFTYALQGEGYVFWSATLNKWEQGPEDEAYPSYARKNYKTHLIGQFPLPGSGGTPAVYKLTVDDEMTSGGGEPQLFRTPDGYLHVVIAVYNYTDAPKWGYSTLRCYRSARPEDVTEWVDRTELIPTQPFDQFHARMNVAVTADGERAVGIGKELHLGRWPRCPVTSSSRPRCSSLPMPTARSPSAMARPSPNLISSR